MWAGSLTAGAGMRSRASHGLLASGAKLAVAATALVAVLAIGSPVALVSPLNAAPRRFAFGVITERVGEADLAFGLYTNLLAALRSRVAASGVEVVPLVIARDTADLARRIERGEVDGFAEGVFPTLAIRALSRSVDPGLLALRRGEREYESIVFVARNGPVHSLDDLRGRTIVFQAPRSTSAYALPKAELLRLGYDVFPVNDPTGPATAIRYVFAKAEINQAIWVLHGKGDAGAFNGGDWARLPAGVRDQLVVIHKTPSILRWVVSFRTGLDPATRQAVEAALVALGDRPGDRSALEAARIERFERLTAADRRSIDRWVPLLARLGIEQ